MTATVRSPALITLILMASCNVITMNMFLPSLPNMAAEFEVTAGVMSGAISGYLFVIAGMQLIVGPLSDWLGRRPVVLAALSIYVMASFACIFAPSIELFFLARFFQAVVVSGMVLAQAIVRDTATDKDAAASRLASVIMVMAIMPMIAPIIGGVLGDLVGWRSNFVLMSGYGAIVLAVVYVTLPETNLNKTATFGKQLQAYPVLLSKLRFWGFALTAMLNLAIFYAFLITMPVVGKEAFGLSRSEIGILLGMVPMGYMIGNSITSFTVKRYGIGNMLMAGRLLVVIGVGGTIVLHWLGVTSPFILFLPLALFGTGNGFVMPSSNAGTVSIIPQLAGTAAGLNGAFSMFFGATVTTVTAYVIQGSPTVGTLTAILMTIGVAGLFPSILLHLTDDRERRAPA